MAGWPSLGDLNPIHKGHIRLAQAARDEMGLERVLLIPTWTPPHKESPDLAPSQHRLAMCRLAAEGHPFLEVDDLEIRRRGRSYTIDTVEELGRREPGRELVLIVGSDMLLTFHQWRRWREILERVTLCAACGSRPSSSRWRTTPGGWKGRGTGAGC